MIRFGLLGCGRIAKRHSDLLGGNHIDGARLVAVCDPVRARADAIAAKFGVPAHYDMDDFLARKDIDAVVGADAERAASAARHRLRQGRQACRGAKSRWRFACRTPTT